MEMLSCEETEEYFKNFTKPKPKKVTYYLRREVVIHNKKDDIWVIVNGRVLNLTEFFLMDTPNDALLELLAYAGKDLSHFFNENNEPKKRINVAGFSVPILVATLEKSISSSDKSEERFWWNDQRFEIGQITSQERRLRIINTLTTNTINVIVCEEDTINDIKRKYSAKYNFHSGSYVWRKKNRDGKHTGQLDLERTLTENGILREKFDTTPPALWLFYTDDFTVG